MISEISQGCSWLNWYILSVGLPPFIKHRSLSDPPSSPHLIRYMIFDAYASRTSHRIEVARLHQQTRVLVIKGGRCELPNPVISSVSVCLSFYCLSRDCFCLSSTTKDVRGQDGYLLLISINITLLLCSCQAQYMYTSVVHARP